MAGIKNLLERYLDGRLSKEEKIDVDDWLTENENPASEWRQLSEGEKQQFISSLHRDILDKINSGRSAAAPVYKLLKWQKAAAAIFLIMLTIGWFIWKKEKAVTPQEAFVILKSKKGEKTQVKLRDGSIVWLNGSGTLRYPNAFSGHSREVWLDGEAYFDIFHDASKRFIVHTGQISTTVLGTAFTIRNDAATNYFAITVLRGKVSVSAGKQQLLGELGKNENLTINRNGQISKTITDAVKTTAWLPQELKFNDLTLVEVVRLLEQRYSKQIKLGNSKLENCRFSGSAAVSASLDDVLNAICAFNNAAYHYQDTDTILIDGVGCN